MQFLSSIFANLTQLLLQSQFNLSRVESFLKFHHLKFSTVQNLCKLIFMYVYVFSWQTILVLCTQISDLKP